MSTLNEIRHPDRTERVCYNCEHWRKKKYNHCQHSGPWGGDITGDPNCTFENKWSFFNAITYALREMERCPDDSTQDIWNEMLEKWNTGLRMNHRLEIEPKP